jgi:ArsR family transcriptional regulator, arsenate/arsenite/antimonite-responsive transcriptional repressor
MNRGGFMHAERQAKPGPQSGCCPGSLPDGELSAGITEPDRILASLAHALGHPARVAILRQLAREGACRCGTIVDSLPLAQATVSQHLRMLKEAGLVRGDVDGPRVCYCINASAVRRLQELVKEL